MEGKVSDREVEKVMINRKICPKCKGKNTQKASKLGFYAGSMFCLDCAIYYNIYVDNQTLEAVTK